MGEAIGIDSLLGGWAMPKAYSGEMRERAIAEVEVELRGARRPRNLRLVPAPQLSGSSAFGRRAAARPNRGAEASHHWRTVDEHTPGGDLRLRIPQGTKISLAADAEAPGVGPPEMT